jgi:serine/alanine adding enzyme
MTEIPLEETAACLNIRQASMQSPERIDAYVRENRRCSIYHLFAWKMIIETVFGNKVYYLVSENADGAVRGVLPMVHIDSFLFGNYFVSMPYFNYGGVCGDTPEIESGLVAEAVRIARSCNAGYVEFRHDSPKPFDFQCKTSKVSMRLDLPGEVEALWNGFHSKLRSQIRRPEKEGMTAEVGHLDLLEGFFDVFSRNMRDLGTPVYPKKFFKAILDAFPEQARIVTVFRNGVPLASGFLIGFRDRLEIPWASSLREHNQLSPNMLLYWQSLKFACEKGYKVFDFGRSTPGEGTYRFKEQWGARPTQLRWYYWLKRPEEMPQLNPKNPKYQLAIRAWKSLPLSLTRLIGPSLVKNLP